MNRNQVIANATLLGVSIVFVAIVMWFAPERALNIFIVCTLSVGFTIVVLWRSKIDQKKDERTMQLMNLGVRNAFIFLILAMPMLSAFIVLEIIIMDATIALWSLWGAALCIAWITFLFYYYN